MKQAEMLIQVQEIITKLEERQRLIARLLDHHDPQLVLLGQHQKQGVDECRALMIRLVEVAKRDDRGDQQRV